jgi:hypothetical protein
MADATNGFHVDELSKIRVLEPDVYQQTQELKEECKDFVDSECTPVIKCFYLLFFCEIVVGKFCSFLETLRTLCTFNFAMFLKVF